MEFIRPDLRIDFLRYRRAFLIVSTVLVGLSTIGMFYPGPRYGLDFGGGAEAEFAFQKPVPPAELRAVVGELGYDTAEIVEVTGASERLLVRVGTSERTARPEDTMERLVAGVQKKYESAPPKLMRIEWVGPRASEQLRMAALQSLFYAIAMIMAYVTMRFDIRFAPGAAVSLIHDALITAGIYVALQKEVTLSTVAALLTVVGYSINDTIVIYDRIRENSRRMAGASLYELINVSTAQTLSRTLTTSGTTIVSITGFFIWGTPTLQDITFALVVGFLLGTYSTIYVASAVTELVDRRFYSGRLSGTSPA